LSRYVVDTSAYTHFQRADATVVELLDAADWIGVPSIVLGELWTGFLLGRRTHENERELREFLAHPAVEQLSIDSDTARVYAEIVVALRKAGTPLPSNDVWIAACAASAGARVLTYDSHFQQIARVGAIVLDDR
jgi:tRNA(fMet)-specific endonuclease VapC